MTVRDCPRITRTNAKQRSRSRVGWLATWVAIAVAAPMVADAQTAADASAEQRAVAELVTSASELPGWKLAEPLRVVVGEDLFELIDGGAEIYQEYGFARALSCRYERGAATLQVELYRMTGVPAAFGVYSMMQSPRGEPVAVGQAGRLFRDYLVFWKGSHYASLTLTGEIENPTRELTAAAEQVAAWIPGGGERPAILQRLNETGLQDSKYLRGPIALSNVYVFGAGDVFGATEAACGVYADRHEFIFNYPSAETASARLAAAHETMANDSAYRAMAVTPEGFECRDPDGRRIIASRQAHHVLVRVERVTSASGG